MHLAGQPSRPGGSSCGFVAAAAQLGSQNRQNKALVDKVDAQGKKFDFILYGDSITQLISRESKAEWAALFPPSKGWVAAALGVVGNDDEDLTWRIIAGSERPKLAPRCIALLIGSNDVNGRVPTATIKKYMDYLLQYLQGWLAAPLGVSGNDVEDLTWRIIGGSELPALAPRCIALLIGSNDVNSHTKLEDHISYLDYLVGYLQAAFPDTQLILWKLLPRQGLDMGPANQAYHALAKRRGLTWVACGRQLDADDPSILYDGTHPTPPTQTQLLRCLAPAVYRLVGKSMRRQATPLGTGGSAAPAPAPAAAGGPGGAAP
ncbi:hypothetical protein ABPG75_004103 [Micractinium tetrahymenae]